jgi:hypothetical protein
VKLDVNGKVSGYGLASTGPTGTGSTFEVRADKFVIAAPAGAAAGYVPFEVLTAPTVIGGVTLPAGVYAQSAYILDGQITNAKIGNLAVDNAKIADLGVNKLIAGNIATGQYIRSSNYVSGTSGFNIDATGAAEFQNVTVRGTVYATAGTFAGSLSAATGTFSGALSAATGTFAGSLSAATGTFSGALSAATGTFSGTLSAASGSFSGNLTAANIITTANVQDYAITNVVGTYIAAFTSNFFYYDTNGQLKSIIDHTYTSTGKTTIVSFNAYYITPTELRGSDQQPFPVAVSFILYRNSTALFDITPQVSAFTNLIGFTLTDTPSAGTVTYSLYAALGGYNEAGSAYSRSITTIETKK